MTGPPQGLASCSAQPFLTVPLVPVANISSISPLGNLNPPPHTFPTDHIYLYMGVFGGAISAPSASVVSNVGLQHRTGGGQAAVDDYEVTFYPCRDVMMQLAHVAGLFPQFRAKVGALDDCNPSYMTGGFTYQQCRKVVNIALAAGEAIGTTAPSLDVTARDRRVTLSYVNPARLSDPVGEFGDKHTACPLDYFEQSIADQMRAKLGPPGQVRTTPPVCGEVMQDVPNTAAGRWFHVGSPTSPEDPHLALAHHNVTPALAAFSIGTSIPSLPAGVYTFTPVSTGRVNLDFRYVTAIGEIECYSVTQNRRVFLQLVSASRLRVEGSGIGACGEPSTWTLSAAAADFER